MHRQTDPAAALAAAIAAHGRALASLRLHPCDTTLQAALDLALTRANALAAAILDAPARTPSAIRAKAAALAWDIEGEDAEGFVMDSFRAARLRGLLDDLHTVLRD